MLRTVRALRRPPALHVVVELEEIPVVRIVADSEADEIRLRRWLQRLSAQRAVADAVADALDELDQREAA